MKAHAAISAVRAHRPGWHPAGGVFAQRSPRAWRDIDGNHDATLLTQRSYLAQGASEHSCGVRLRDEASLRRGSPSSMMSPHRNRGLSWRR